MTAVVGLRGFAPLLHSTLCMRNECFSEKGEDDETSSPPSRIAITTIKTEPFSS